MIVRMNTFPSTFNSKVPLGQLASKQPTLFLSGHFLAACGDGLRSYRCDQHSGPPRALGSKGQDPCFFARQTLCRAFPYAGMEADISLAVVNYPPVPGSTLHTGPTNTIHIYLYIYPSILLCMESSLSPSRTTIPAYNSPVRQFTQQTAFWLSGPDPQPTPQPPSLTPHLSISQLHTPRVHGVYLTTIHPFSLHPHKT
jgi:hypothetical protein